MDLFLDRLQQLQTLNETTGGNAILSEEDYFSILDEFFKNSTQNPPNNATPSYLVFYSYNGRTSFSYSCIEYRFVRFDYLKNLYNHGVKKTNINQMIRFFMKKYFDVDKVTCFDYPKVSKVQKMVGVQGASPE